MMKKILLLSILLIIMVTTMPVHTFARTPGALYGVNLNVGKMIDNTISTTSKLTDDDPSTGVTILYSRVPSGNKIWYKFPDPQNIKGFYVDWVGDYGISVTFYDSSKSTIARYTPNFGGFAKKQIYSVDLNDVTYVEVSNNSENDNTFYEFEVYNDELDITPPGDITINDENINDTSATITWENPTDSDFDHVEIYMDGETITTNENSITFKNLSPGSSHTVTFYAVDKSGNKSSGITKTFTTTNTNPPGEVTDISESHDYQSFSLTFDNPKDADFDHVNIYINGEFDGSAVYGDYLKSGLKPLTTYNVKITTVDSAGNESDGVTITIKTDDAPIPGVSGSTITKNKDGDYVLSWENDDITGTADIYIGGKKWGSTDVDSSPITIPNEDIKETLTGIEVVKVVPVSETGKSPPYDEVPPAVYKDGVKEKMENFITAWGILKSVFSFVGVLSGIILLALAVHFSKPLMKAIKNAIKGVRR